jgi:uncharacterized protein
LSLFSYWPLFLFLIVLLPAVRWFERANLYFPVRGMDGGPELLGLKFEDLRLTTSDQTMVHAWYVEDTPASPVMLVCHGNGGNISHRLDKLRLFRQAGASVLLFDYRGYGLSSGRPDEKGTYMDAEAAYRWLTGTKKVPAERVVIYGESLGGAVALETALRHPAAGLILDSAFTSVVDMGKRIFPFLPIDLMVRCRYDNLAKIAQLRAPLLVMHSPQDDIVPFDMGRMLFESAPEPKVFFALRGSHNEGFLDTGPAYVEAIASFLKDLSARGCAVPGSL